METVKFIIVILIWLKITGVVVSVLDVYIESRIGKKELFLQEKYKKKER